VYDLVFVRATREGSMSRWAGSLVLVVAVAAVLMAGSASGRSVAHTAGTCSVGSGRGYGYSYLTYLWVYKTNCSTGRNVARHHGHVKGWGCKKKILDRSPVQYDAKVTCRSGKRQVQWTYTQNT
jgi:hypothetical protein